MSMRYKGSVISATAPTVAGNAASGVWTLVQQMQYQAAGTWPFAPYGGPSAIAVAHDVSPYISTYPWSAGFGTKYANPATLPTGGGYSVAFL